MEQICREEFKFPCNKCDGQVMIEYIINYDDWKYMHFNKMYCSECGREFFGYSFDKTKEGLACNFAWDNWKDDNHG